MANDQPNALHQSFEGILITDVMASMERHRTADSQQSRRDLIRTVFAAVEGLAWKYREHVVAVARETQEITFEEEMALSEVNYQVSDQGKVVGQTRFISMPASIRLATRISMRLDPDLDIRFDSAGWNQFRQSITVRNRITHPKHEADLIISVEDVSTCLASLFWLLEVSERAMAVANTALARYAHMLGEFVDKLMDGDPGALALYEAVGRTLDD